MERAIKSIIKKPITLQCLLSQCSIDSRKSMLLLSLPIIVFIFSFPIGQYPISLEQLIKILISKVVPIEHTWPATLDIVVFQIRLPRIIAAMLVGLALSTSGAVYQGMFKNPLVSPDILGASAGSAFGAALAIYFSFGILGIQVMSFLFGLTAVFLTYVISNKIRHDAILTLVMAGIVVGTLFSSGTSLIKYIADPFDKLPAITFWLMGSLSSINSRDVYISIIPIFAGLIPLYLLRWHLNVLSLGEEEARALGVDTSRLRLLVILCSTLMTASAVSISGIIGWIGLIIPHLARMLTGPNYKDLLPASIFIGSSYLLLVDDIARGLASAEIPLGIITSLVGAPFFIYLLSKTPRRWT
ncbi:MAG: iron complex transport system permease protein [Clostridia bacterium]|nr:iron complex transport system permease protein [Clostridia bacterium]